ncbi:Hypothetical protein HVR_LOCUS239 [uncultured virus]|nr:Hypothetical protein HVR_LOCUS239 [uncultured virus]
MAELRILSYNCDKGNCKLAPGKVSYIGNIITQANADIVCLQEYSQTVAQQLLPYRLEESYIFITSPINQGWSENIIYSKLPILKSWFVEMDGKNRKSPIITVQTSNGPITIACIHLDFEEICCGWELAPIS